MAIHDAADGRVRPLLAGGAVTDVPKERATQRAILAMCGVCFPDVFIHHSPNGAYFGGSDKVRRMRGGIMAGDGCKAGFPDLICLWKGGAALLEVKREKGGTVSDAQRVVHERLSAIGWPVSIVRSQTEAFEALAAAGAPCVGVLAA